MTKSMRICAVIAVAAVNANAAITVNFTEVDVGGSWAVNLTNQFAAYGITFDHVYRYIDTRDPWKENGPQNPSESPPTIGYGISNGWVLEAGTLGTVLFTLPTPYVTIDWWDIDTNVVYVDAYDATDNLLDSFTGPANPGVDSGTTTLSGPGLISYMTLHDGGGYVSIANMTYEPIPAPGAILLGGVGVCFVGWLRRRKSL